MEITYDSAVIESILNALNKLQVTGITNAEIITFIVQRLGENKKPEDGVV